MLMRRIRNGFLSADPMENPDAFRTTAGLVGWGESLTSFWTTMGQTVAKHQQFTAIHAQCVSLAQPLQLRLTFYGHARSFVPRASLSFYQSSLEKVCESLASLENDAIAYETALQKHTDAASELRQANARSKDQITALEAKLSEVTTRMQLLQG